MVSVKLVKYVFISLHYQYTQKQFSFFKSEDSIATILTFEGGPDGWLLWTSLLALVRIGIHVMLYSQNGYSYDRDMHEILI